jgi:hypothetical protein
MNEAGFRQSSCDHSLRPIANMMSVAVRAPQWWRHRPPCSHSVDGEVQQQDGGKAQRGGGPRPP